MSDDNDLRDLKEHIASLPGVIRNAINSTNTSEFLQRLAKEHSITLDKWSELEVGVTMVLVGALEPSQLRDFLITEVGVAEEEVDPLLEKINTGIFDPIRKELERELDHPEAEEKQGTPIEDMTAEILANKERGLPADAPKPEEKPVTETAAAPAQQAGMVVRTPVSESYKPGQVSSARADVHSDPYRETP